MIIIRAAKRHKNVSPDGFPMDHVFGLLSHLIVLSAKGTQPSYDKLSSLRYLDSKGIRYFFPFLWKIFIYFQFTCFYLILENGERKI